MEIVEEIFKKTTEEYKAMKWLKDKIDDCNDDCLTINYNMILYYLVINLLKKNKQLKTNRDEAIELILNHQLVSTNEYNLYHTDIVQLKSILERGINEDDCSFDNPILGVPTFLSKMQELERGKE